MSDLPDLGVMDDGIANGTYEAQAGEAQPLSLFTAARVDYSLHRLRHYTGTAPEWFQNFVLFTNYQFYIDEFVRLGHEAMADENSEYVAFIEPGNVITRRRGLPAGASTNYGGLLDGSQGTAPPRLPQMPAYHLVREDCSGISMVNIGVGPANAKTITDHIAVLRPHAWMMLGHCAGPAQRAAAWATTCWPTPIVREDHVLDVDTAAVGADPGRSPEYPARAGKSGGRRHALRRARPEEDHAHGHGGEHATTATGSFCPATSRSAASARAGRWRSTWKAPPSRPTASASGCPTARFCA